MPVGIPTGQVQMNKASKAFSVYEVPGTASMPDYTAPIGPRGIIQSDGSVPTTPWGTGPGDAMSGKFSELQLDQEDLMGVTPTGRVLRSTDDIIGELNDTLNIQNPSDTPGTTYSVLTRKYNRFKIALPNSMLRAGYPHVFFVRPNCYIFDNSSTGGASTRKIQKSLQGNPLFSYANSSRTGQEMLGELTSGSTDFMMSLSNAVMSFSPSDEYITDDTYGRGYSGYKIAFGKKNVESRTAGTIDVQFQDDRDLHIYQTHKLWGEYIHGVFTGEISPRVSDILGKIIDYAGAIYYIITAEDGETILFWTKYYGVFPTTMPSSQLAWASGNTIDSLSTQLNITYRYSWKYDYDPLLITEFNLNSSVTTGGVKEYVPIYDAGLGHSGTTWVGDPYIQETDSDGSKKFLLRFLQ